MAPARCRLAAYGHHVEREFRPLADQRAGEGLAGEAAEEIRPPAPDHQMRHVARAGEVQRGGDERAAGADFDFGAQARGHFQGGAGGVQPVGPFQVEHDPWGAQGVGEPLGLAHHRLGPGVGAGQSEHAIGRRPGTGNGVGAHEIAHILVHPLGGAAQADLAQRRQVAFAKKIIECTGRDIGPVDVPVLQPGAQFAGRDVDELDLVGHFHHAVGQGFGDAHAGDAGDIVVQAFEVLHVERGPDVDAGLEQLCHVLPALGVAAAGRVGVGEFVDQEETGFARQRAIHIELFEHLAAIGDGAAWQDGQFGDLLLGAGAAVGFDDADQNVAAGCKQRTRRGQHLPGFANPRRRPQKHL